jgi:hypothetical protein
MLRVSRVRKAEREDIPDLLDLCVENHAENGMFELSDQRVKEMIDRHFNKGGAIVGIVGKPGAKIEASICLLIANMWYSDDFHLEDIWTYVRPQYRSAKLNNLEHLIRFAERCSDELGIRFFGGIMSSIRTEAKIRIYRRLMGEPVGAFFMYDPKAKKIAQAG